MLKLYRHSLYPLSVVHALPTSFPPLLPTSVLVTNFVTSLSLLSSSFPSSSPSNKQGINRRVALTSSRAEVFCLWRQVWFDGYTVLPVLNSTPPLAQGAVLQLRR